jgi:hypothetical protein
MPCPEGLAWLLLGCSVLFSIAKAMPKGSYGINIALYEIMLKFTKLNDLKKWRQPFLSLIILRALLGLAPVEGVAEKPKALERGGRLPPFEL